MAETTVDSTTIDGVTFELKAIDNASPSLEQIQKYLAELSAAYTASGKTAQESFAKVVEKLHELERAGQVTSENFRKIWNDMTAKAGLSEAQKLVAKFFGMFYVSEQDREKIKNIDEMGKAFLRLGVAVYAVVKPMQKLVSFYSQIAEKNMQFSLMAQSAMMGAGELAAEGGTVSAAGGSANDMASFRRRFELEMEKRRIGMGNGGQFTQALIRYGLNYDPNDANATMRNYIRFFSDANRTDAEKQQAGALLGLSQGMIAAMSRGEAWWDSSNAENAGLTENRAEATKAAAALKEETVKLALAWQDFKDKMLVSLGPVLVSLMRFTRSLVQLVKPLAPLIAWLGMVKAAIVSFAALRTLPILIKSAISTVVQSFRGFGSAAKKTAQSVAEATTEIARTTTSTARTTANVVEAGANGARVATTTANAGTGMAGMGALGALGPWGIALGVVGVVSSVTSTIMGGIQRHNTNTMLESIKNIVAEWRSTWRRSVGMSLSTGGGMDAVEGVLEDIHASLRNFFGAILGNGRNVNLAGMTKAGTVVNISKIEVNGSLRGGDGSGASSVEAQVSDAVRKAFIEILD